MAIDIIDIDEDIKNGFLFCFLLHTQAETLSLHVIILKRFSELKVELDIHSQCQQSKGR
jgi:hypothetical protein